MTRHHLDRYRDARSDAPLSPLPKYLGAHRQDDDEYRPSLHALRTPQSLPHPQYPLYPPGCYWYCSICLSLPLHEYRSRGYTVTHRLMSLCDHRHHSRLSLSPGRSHGKKPHTPGTAAVTRETKERLKPSEKSNNLLMGDMYGFTFFR